MSSRIALAAPSQLAADAAQFVAQRHGNAADAAIAAALVAINTEPGVCALAGGGFVTLWRPGEAPTAFDGYVAVPGKDSSVQARDGDVEAVTMAYGGGVTTLVGAGSVAVPGTLAALCAAWQDAGVLDWADVLAPAIAAARDGFPLSQACHHYLTFSGEPIYSRSADSRRALFDGSSLRPAGSLIRVPHLAESLTMLAQHGPDAFYRGALSERILDYTSRHGGSLSAADLADYRAERRAALRVDIGDWQLALNPPPAIGGAVLGAVMIALQQRQRYAAGSPVDTLIAALKSVLAYRRDVLDESRQLDLNVRLLLDACGIAVPATAGSTIHVSAVDGDGLACSVTASSGYGSGDMPPGTGLWLNNSLGEIDLNRHGLDAGAPGARLPSNMAPSCARRRDDVLSIGSPGASRITTALAQTLYPVLTGGQTLRAAIGAPRLHVDYDGDGFLVAAERGLDGLDAHDVRWYPPLDMYFGGVGAAWRIDGRLDAAADPRRTGSVFVTNT